MKESMMIRALFGAAVILVLLVGSMGMAGEASAALGNAGVPVRCFAPGAGVAAGGSAFLTCYAADGTAFDGNQRVPVGYYLYVTDVLVTPRAGSATSGVTELSVFSAHGTSSRQSQFYLRSIDTGTYSHTFSAPYLVLPADFRLEVVAAGINAYPVDVRVTGVLTTHMLWLPVTRLND
jgi:hypothetical protein